MKKPSEYWKFIYFKICVGGGTNLSQLNETKQVTKHYPHFLWWWWGKDENYFLSILNQDPADCPEMSVYDQCWHDTCISWNTWTCIFVRNQDIVADGPLSTFGFWTPYCSWNPDWRLMFGIRTSDSNLFGTFLLYFSMMWKHFYYRHDQGWVRSVIKCSSKSRLCSDWSRRQPNRNQLEIPTRERPNED